MPVFRRGLHVRRILFRPGDKKIFPTFLKIFFTFALIYKTEKIQPVFRNLKWDSAFSGFQGKILPVFSSEGKGEK